MAKTKDITGMRFGRLVALYPVAGSSKSPRRWVCQCDCGNTSSVITRDLGNGNTTSCGCYIREIAGMANVTHGKSKSSAYNVWSSMLQRCENPSSSKYRYYGGRGIVVCKRWHDFTNFYEDMGDKPYRHTLDRIDNDGPYSPENCRWATQATQNKNRRSNVVVEYHGETMCLTDWATRLGVDYETLRQRIQRYGWSVEKAFTYPVQPRELQVTFDGETLSLEDWAKRTGLDARLIYSRIHKDGWTVEKALLTPKVTEHKRTSLGQWAKE